jgi:ubiquinone/menaquinone biosynthesis C-methylase UbiE
MRASPYPKKNNARWIDINRVEIRQGSVSQLPFPDDTFDLVTAVETHYFWPDLPADMREVFRVLKPGGAVIMIAETYKGSKTASGKLAEKIFPHGGHGAPECGRASRALHRRRLLRCSRD